MGYISSINFKKSNPIQTRHNDRDLPPNYLIGGAFESNRNHAKALTLRNVIIQNAIEAYNRTKPPKAPNFKAKSYEWSAVCNIKPDTTMQDLERLAKHFETKYGFQCYQIAIHRDEGHIDDNGLEQINHHAHLEFITLDKETGRSLFRAELQRPKALRQIQTEVAEILQMERGEDKRVSKRERIEPRKYGAMKEQERKALRFEKALMKNAGQNFIVPICEELGVDTSKQTTFTKLGDQATQEITSLKAIKAHFEILRKEMIEWGFCNKDDYKIRTDLLKQTIEDAKKKQFTQDDLKTAIANATQAILEKHKQDIETLQKSHKQEKQAIEAKISDLKSKQGVGITQDEISDLKANYEVGIDSDDYQTKQEPKESNIDSLLSQVAQAQQEQDKTTQTPQEKIQEKHIEVAKQMQRQKPKSRGFSR